MLLVIYVSPSPLSSLVLLTLSILATTANIQYASHDIKVTLLHNPSHLGIHRAIPPHSFTDNFSRGYQSCSDGHYSSEAILDAA